MHNQWHNRRRLGIEELLRAPQASTVLKRPLRGYLERRILYCSEEKLEREPNPTDFSIPRVLYYATVLKAMAVVIQSLL